MKRKLARNLLVVFAVVALVGFIKMPHDERLVAGMRQRDLIADPIKIDTMEELGQTSLAITLGGLRSVIAPLLNIGAHVDWENQRWYELEKKYRTIVTLQPHTRYYWRAAHGHLASNAYADYEDRRDVPEGQRKDLQRAFFEKGIAFLEEGIQENPDDPWLWAYLGQGLSEVYRPRDLSRAAEAFQRSYELMGSLQAMRQRVYALARIPGREADAWEAAKEMWAIPQNRRYLSPRTVYYNLQCLMKPPPSETLTIEQIFGSPKLTLEQSRRVALMDLADYWFRQYEDYPAQATADTINRLCAEFGIPQTLHPLRFAWDREFSVNPITGEPFKTDPVTGRVRKRQWRSIWMGMLREEFRNLVKNGIP